MTRVTRMPAAEKNVPSASRGVLLVLAGFAGVLLIARPGSGLAPMGVVFALVGAATSVVYVLLSRSLAASETTMAMLFHAALAGAVLFGAMVPGIGTAPPSRHLTSCCWRSWALRRWCGIIFSQQHTAKRPPRFSRPPPTFTSPGPLFSAGSSFTMSRTAGR